MRMMRRGLCFLIPSALILLTTAMVGRPAARPIAASESRPPAKDVPAEVATVAAEGLVAVKPPDAAAAVPAATRVVREPIFRVEVSRRLHLDGDAAARYASVAERLSRFSAVPDDRRRQFSGYREADEYGWAGAVMDVRETPVGRIVEVWVAPRSSLIHYPPSVYFEHFLIAPDGAVTFLRSSDPHGGAGRSPLASVGI